MFVALVGIDDIALVVGIVAAAALEPNAPVPVTAEAVVLDARGVDPVPPKLNPVVRELALVVDAGTVVDAEIDVAVRPNPNAGGADVAEVD